MRFSDDLVVLPVHHVASGGYLLKIKNAAGDRVISAIDFFRSNGIDEEIGAEFSVVWNDERAGLVARDVFKTAN